jgi:hypothetical protein
MKKQQKIKILFSLNIHEHIFNFFFHIRYIVIKNKLLTFP